MQILLATNNKHKLEEFRRIFNSTDIEILSLSDKNISIDVEEDSDTFEGNSFKKASEVQKISKIPTIADDSGICIDYLNGEPGVYSARYGGEGLNDTDRCNLVLQKLDGVEHDKRGAKFVCVITLVLDEDNFVSFRGECNGIVGTKIIGQGGFGYDPIFMVGDKSFSQMTAKQKDDVSHRGKALEKLFEYFTQEKGDK